MRPNVKPVESTINPLAYIAGVTKHIGNEIPKEIAISYKGFDFEGKRELDMGTGQYTVTASYAGYKVTMYFDGSSFELISHQFEHPKHEMSGGTPVLVGIRIRAATERWMKEAHQRGTKRSEEFMRHIAKE